MQLFVGYIGFDSQRPDVGPLESKWKFDSSRLSPLRGVSHGRYLLSNGFVLDF